MGPLADEKGDTSRFLLTLIDRTQEMMIERNLRRELVSDSLTGMPNRAGFVELVEMSVEGEEPAEHALLVSDLARFRRSKAHRGQTGTAVGRERGCQERWIVGVGGRIKKNHQH